jgi:hypothetical protein
MEALSGRRNRELNMLNQDQRPPGRKPRIGLQVEPPARDDLVNFLSKLPKYDVPYGRRVLIGTNYQRLLHLAVDNGFFPPGWEPRLHPRDPLRSMLDEHAEASLMERGRREVEAAIIHALNEILNMPVSKRTMKQSPPNA